MRIALRVRYTIDKYINFFLDLYSFYFVSLTIEKKHSPTLLSFDKRINTFFSLVLSCFLKLGVPKTESEKELGLPGFT